MTSFLSDMVAAIATLTAERDALRAELGNIVRANWRTWEDGSPEEFVAWAQNRARAALTAQEE